MATPLTGVKTPPPAGAPAPASSSTKPQDRRLRLDDILKLMLADGLVPAAEAEMLAKSRTHRFDHPLEAIADRKWKSAKPPHRLMTLEFLVEWLSGKLGIPYFHIDPLKIDLGAVTATMSSAYAERYRILPVAVDRQTLTVATSEPFIRSWADELAEILKLEVKFVFANPIDIKRYVGEFFNLARSMKRAQAASKGQLAVGNFEQLVELGKHGLLDANDQHVVHIVDWLWQYAFEQRASDIHIEPRRDVGLVRFGSTGSCTRFTPFRAVLIVMTSRIKLARMEIAEKRRPQDGRIKTLAPDGQEVGADLDDADRVRRSGDAIFTPEVLVRDYADLRTTTASAGRR